MEITRRVGEVDRNRFTRTVRRFVSRDGWRRSGGKAPNYARGGTLPIDLVNAPVVSGLNR